MSLSEAGVPNLWALDLCLLSDQWQHEIRNKVHKKCKWPWIILKPSPLPLSLWKNCLPWNWLLMPKRLETADLKWGMLGVKGYSHHAPLQPKSQLERNRRPFCSLPPSTESANWPSLGKVSWISPPAWNVLGIFRRFSSLHARAQQEVLGIFGYPPPAPAQPSLTVVAQASAGSYLCTEADNNHFRGQVGKAWPPLNCIIHAWDPVQITAPNLSYDLEKVTFPRYPICTIIIFTCESILERRLD